MATLKKNPDGTPHVHMFVRVEETNTGREIRYHCTHPDCSCIMPRNVLKGKRTICGVCHTKETTFDYENLRRAVPRCVNCSATKKAAAVREKMDVLSELFGAGQ